MNEFEVNFSENAEKMNADFTDGTRFLNGKSAYDIAVENGFEGTETEWLESLKGRDGKDGENGADGADGEQGIPGLDGKDGKHAYVFTSTGSGTAFVGTIGDYENYTAGDLFVMIPHTASTSTSPTLRINNLSAYYIKRRSATTTFKSFMASSCIAKGIPELLMFTGSYFLAIEQRQPYGGTDFYTSVSVSKGGTGRTSWTANRLLYASSSSYISQLYPPSEESVLMQKSSGAPYWKSKEVVTSGLMSFKGVHNDSTKMPTMVKGHTYKITTDVTIVPQGDVEEVSCCVDSSSSIYFYDYGFEMYGYNSNACYTELVKILPSEYIGASPSEPFTLIVIPKSNLEDTTPYVFYCTGAYCYEYEYEDGVEYWANFSGNWQDNICPTDGVYSGNYITLRIPTGSYPAGTYVCTGADWESLI